jgi:hypothetical protein
MSDSDKPMNMPEAAMFCLYSCKAVKALGGPTRDPKQRLPATVS